MHLSQTSIFSAAVAIASLLGVASASSSCKSTTGLTQMIVYVKRHPDYTREEFWKYWGDHHAPKVAPLASHLNITRYQQGRRADPPTAAGATEPASKELVEFDGIAMFLYEKDETLLDFLAHPYYTEVVQPDERVVIDQEAFGAGQVAVFTGYHAEIVNDAKDVWVGDEKERQKYKEMFDSYN